MEITEVRIKLMEDNSGSNERLQAFCSITFDDMFVIRDLKIIEGAKGFFVAMPSRKLTDRCGHCGTKNHLRSRFCNQCGSRLDENRAIRDADGRAKLHADIAHPINSMCREKIQGAVLASLRRRARAVQDAGLRLPLRRPRRRRVRRPLRRPGPRAWRLTAVPRARRSAGVRSAATPSTPASGMRGPHVAPRKEASPEGVASDHRENGLQRLRRRALSRPETARDQRDHDAEARRRGRLHFGSARTGAGPAAAGARVNGKTNVATTAKFTEAVRAL